MNQDEVIAISELLHTLVLSYVPDWEQQRLNLFSARAYIEDTANKVAQMYLDKRIDHDTYHELMGDLRMIWFVVNRVITEEFEEKTERELRVRI